ncbi:MAG TPA: hypothetical protein DGG95_07740 [Cytophagales bacterium]|nr:hypothetical protein [Cytophagales bacterium]
MIPKDLMNIFVNGNAAYVGQTASISPKAESTTLLETSLGGAYQVDEKLTVGVRLKFLKGITNLTTQSANMTLTEDSNFALTANASMDVRSSGIHNFSDSNFDFGNHIHDYLKNNGFAIDLGATYKLNDKLALGASLIDIGKIHWQNNTYGYRIDPEKANYTFPGVDLSKVINGNGDYLKSLGDTLQNRFQVQQNPIGSYSTPLPGKMYLNGMYEVKKNLTLGAVFFSERFRGRLSSGLTLGANKHFGKWVSTSLTYTVTSNSFNNIGAGFSLNLAPVQIYFVGDNILRMPLGGMDHYISTTKYFNLRMGLNFVLGWDKKGGASGRSIKSKGDHLPGKLYEK